jgi:hypothetical protein
MFICMPGKYNSSPIAELITGAHSSQAVQVTGWPGSTGNGLASSRGGGLAWHGPCWSIRILFYAIIIVQHGSSYQYKLIVGRVSWLK